MEFQFTDLGSQNLCRWQRQTFHCICGILY